MNIETSHFLLRLSVSILFFLHVYAADAQCDAYSGTLADDPIVQNADGSFQLRAFRQNNLVIPAGYEVFYFLSFGIDRLLIASDPGSSFRVTSPGYYRIHTLVAELTDTNSQNFISAAEYAPDGRTIPEIVAEFGSRCASLDELGAQFFVPSDFGASCTIQAGSLSTYGAELTEDRQQVLVGAIVEEENVAPGNFESRYLLTRNQDNTIVSIGTSASFVISAQDTGLYTIYPFVAELTDPLSKFYYNEADIILGQTRLTDLVEDYVDRDVCARASFDGAQSYVPLQPTQTSCVAESGRLSASITQLNPSLDTARLIASRVFPVFLLSGQEVVYLLSSGSDLKIIDFSSFPTFDITQPGSFHIHSAVLEKTDDTSPNYFDLSTIHVDNFTISSLTTFLVQQGVCASIEEEGAEFQIDDTQISSLRNPAISTAKFSVWQAGGDKSLSIRLTSSLNGVATISVLDALGREVARQQLSVSANLDQQVELPVSGTAGVYFVRLQDAEGELVKKVMLR